MYTQPWREEDMDRLMRSRPGDEFVYHFQAAGAPNAEWQHLRGDSAFKFTGAKDEPPFMSVESLDERDRPVMIFHMEDIEVDDGVCGEDDTVQPMLNRTVEINDDTHGSFLFTVTTARQLLETRLMCTVAGEPFMDERQLLQKDCVSVGGPMPGGKYGDDVVLKWDQAGPHALRVTRRDECVEIENGSDGVVNVNGMLLAPGKLMCTQPGEAAVVASAGRRSADVPRPFKVLVQTFEPPSAIRS